MLLAFPASSPVHDGAVHGQAWPARGRPRPRSHVGGGGSWRRGGGALAARAGDRDRPGEGHAGHPARRGAAAVCAQWCVRGMTARRAAGQQRESCGLKSAGRCAHQCRSGVPHACSWHPSWHVVLGAVARVPAGVPHLSSCSHVGASIAGLLARSDVGRLTCGFPRSVVGEIWIQLPADTRFFGLVCHTRGTIVARNCSSGGLMATTKILKRGSDLQAYRW
jgi:hypothetical protein